MEQFGSLGMLMNQAAEAKHKEGVLAWVPCGCGGVQGSTAAPAPAESEPAVQVPGTQQRTTSHYGPVVPPPTPKGTPRKKGR
eukprot:255361-Rhodomonas_salina.1